MKILCYLPDFKLTICIATDSMKQLHKYVSLYLECQSANDKISFVCFLYFNIGLCHPHLQSTVVLQCVLTVYTALDTIVSIFFDAGIRLDCILHFII